MLHLLAQEVAGIPWYVVVFVLIAVIVAGSVFWLTQREANPEAAITTTRIEVAKPMTTTSNVPVAPRPEDFPATSASIPQNNRSPNAAIAARQQIKAQIQAGYKLTVDATANEEAIPTPTPSRLSTTATDMLHEAEVQRSAGRSDLATRKVRELLLREPQNAAALEMLGDLLAATGDRTAAAEAYRESARSNPGSGRVCMSLAKTLEGLGDIQAAIAAYRAATVADPTDHKAYNNLGGLLAETGDMAGGVDAFQKALAISPDDETAKENLALAQDILRESTATA